MVVKWSAKNLETCCCGRIFIQTGAIGIALTELSLLTVGLIVISFAFSHLSHEGTCYFVAAMIAVPLYAAATSFMLWGVFKARAWWLAPHIALQMLTILITVALVVATLTGNPWSACRTESKPGAGRLDSYMDVIALSFFGVFGLLQCWLLVLQIQCFLYFRFHYARARRGLFLFSGNTKNLWPKAPEKKKEEKYEDTNEHVESISLLPIPTITAPMSSL